MNQESKEVKIQTRATDAVLSGTYANHLMLHMNREEFVLDFISVVPPHATLNARVTVSPGNFKKMLQAMQGGLERYEKEFGPLPSAPQTTANTEIVQ
jgi:hypothetical protein